MKKVKKNLLKIVIFTAVKYCCILHGPVCVMQHEHTLYVCLTHIAVRATISSPGTTTGVGAVTVGTCRTILARASGTLVNIYTG